MRSPLPADVPFLTTEAPLALAWGRGDRMLALPTLPARRVHLAVFAEGVNTADAYGALAAARAERPSLVRPILWTPERLGRWDMYVDLEEHTIRYCFLDPADAQDFIRSFVKLRDAG